MPTVEAGRANKPGRLMQPLIREYVSKLPPETVQTYRRTFNQFDRNRSGTVDVRELGVMFRALRQFPTEDDLRRLVADVDDDMSGVIEFNEFCGLLLRLGRAASIPRWLQRALAPPPAGDPSAAEAEADGAEGADAGEGPALAQTADSATASAALATASAPPVDADAAELELRGGWPAPLADAETGALDLSGRLHSVRLQLMAADLLSAATHVRALVLDANPLGGEGATQLAAALLRLPTLVSLSLARCALTDADAAAVGALAHGGAALERLDLTANDLGDAAAAALADALRAGGAPRLARADLGGNARVTAAAFETLAAYLLRNTLESTVRAGLPDVALRAAGLRAIHAPVLRAALLPPPPAAPSAHAHGRGGASGGGGLAAALGALGAARAAAGAPLPTALDLSDNVEFGGEGVALLFDTHGTVGEARPPTPAAAAAAAASPRPPPRSASPALLARSASAPRGSGAAAGATVAGSAAAALLAPPPAAEPAARQPVVRARVHAMLWRVSSLRLERVGLGDSGCAVLAAALAANELPALRALSLASNPPLGASAAAAAALGALGGALGGRCGGLRAFSASRCTGLTDAAATALLAAWLPAVAAAHARAARVPRSGGLGSVIASRALSLFLGGTRAGDGAARALADALGAGLCCETVALGARVGDAGAAALGGALGADGVVRTLQLGDRIADEGALALAEGLRGSAHLRRLALGGALIESDADARERLLAADSDAIVGVGGAVGGGGGAVGGGGGGAGAREAVGPGGVSDGGVSDGGAEQTTADAERAWARESAALARGAGARQSVAAALASGARPPPMPADFVSNAAMGEAAALALGDALRAHDALERLDLQGCVGLGDGGVGAILGRLGRNVRLRIVTAAGCGVAEAERQSADAPARGNWGGKASGGAVRSSGGADAAAAARGAAAAAGEGGVGGPSGGSTALRALREVLRSNWALHDVRLFAADEAGADHGGGDGGGGGGDGGGGGVSFASARARLEARALLQANREKGEWRLIEESRFAGALEEWRWVFAELAPRGQDYPPIEWTRADIVAFVERCGLAQYARALGASVKSGKALLGLSAELLVQLGVRDFAHQRHLLDRIRSVRLAFEKVDDVRKAHALWEASARALVAHRAAKAKAAVEAEEAAAEAAARAARHVPLSVLYPVGHLPRAVFGKTELPPSRALAAGGGANGVPRKSHSALPHRLAPITGMPRRYTDPPAAYEPPPPPVAAGGGGGRAGGGGRRARSPEQVLAALAKAAAKAVGARELHPAIAELQQLVRHGDGRLAGRGGGRSRRGARRAPPARLHAIARGGALSAEEVLRGGDELLLDTQSKEPLKGRTLALPLDAKPNLLV